MTSEGRTPAPSEQGSGRRTESDWRFENSRNGPLTVFVDGKALHSRFDPENEARRAAGTVPSDAATVVLGGFGLGYVAEELCASAPSRRLIIADADPDILGKIDGRRNLSEMMNNPAVTLFLGGEATQIQELLRGGPAGAKIHYLEWKPSAALNPAWYAELARTVDQTVQRREVNSRTLDRFGPLWVRNLAANTEALVRGISLEPWQDAMHGIPALVLAGGPSLEKILPDLLALRESHLIISVDTALPALVRRKVRPDVIVAVDPQYWNTRHLDRCTEGAGDALVLAESATHPAVFRKLGGRPWLTRTRFPLGTLLENAADIRGELKAGGSVATAAWDLARFLGCSPMTVAGLDLGFPGNRTHYSGSLSRTLPLCWSCRTGPAENLFYHALRDAGARPVEAFGGGTILSDARMDIYTAWFGESASALAGRSPSVVGEGGRLIRGMDRVSLERLRRRPSRRGEIDSIMSKVRKSPTPPDRKERIKKHVVEIVEALGSLSRAASEGVKLADKAMESLAAGENPGKQIEAMNRVDQRILNESGRDLVSFLIQPLILEMSGETDTSGDSPLVNSRRLYQEMADSAKYHIRCLSGI